MTEPVYIVTPVGRIVQGNVFEGSDKDMNGRPRVTQAGLPKTQWYIGLAVPKGPEMDALWAQIYAVGQRDFPAGDYSVAGFAWKIEDGDSAKYAGKEGLAGHMLLRMSQGFAPNVFDRQNQPLVDPTSIKRGDYVLVRIGVAGNGERPATQGGKPGVYLNPNMIKLAGYGEAISAGPSAADAFGAAPAGLPPGASATPVASAAGMPAAPVPVAPVAPAPVAVPPTMPPAPAPIAPVAPAAGVGLTVPTTASPSNLPPGVAPAPSFLGPQ